MSESPKKTTVLIILDGWGHRDDPTDNAIALAGVKETNGRGRYSGSSTDHQERQDGQADEQEQTNTHRNTMRISLPETHRAGRIA